jgi:L-2-hydroxyglutarate oxidase LhgO
MDYDIIIIGAGVVGLALGSKLSENGKKCLIVDKNDSFGMETSSRNSEVIHAGIYYPQNTLKALLCVQGSRLLFDWCEKKNVPFAKIGKYINAIDQEDESKLDSILENAKNNGVENIYRVDSAKFNIEEPNIIGCGAILSENTGIVNSHKLMASLEENAQNNGADIAYSHKFIDAKPEGSGFRAYLQYSDDSVFDVSCEYIINSGGLNADSIASIFGINIIEENLELSYCKGRYFRINSYPNISNRLIYPIPPSNNHGLGIHLTRELDGGAKLGPDTLYVDKNNFDYTVEEELKQAFFESAAKYIKNLKIEQLAPDQSGIRPKLQKATEKFRDFYIKEESDKGIPGLINLIGIESPGLTSSIAIANYVSEIIK